MSEDQGLPRTPDEVREFMDGLSFEPEPSAQQQKKLLESLPEPGSPVMVVRSIRLPVDLHERVKKVAEARGVPATTLIREWIEVELSALENDQPISRADALRALAALRPVGDNHAA
jgi:predicted DNA-binding protein